MFVYFIPDHIIIKMYPFETQLIIILHHAFEIFDQTIFFLNMCGHKLV